MYAPHSIWNGIEHRWIIAPSGRFDKTYFILKKVSTLHSMFLLLLLMYSVLATLMLYISQVRPHFMTNDNVSSRFFGHSKLGVVVLVINGFHYRPLNLLNTRTEISCKTRSIIYLGSYRSYYRVEKIVISLCGSWRREGGGTKIIIAVGWPAFHDTLRKCTLTWMWLAQRKGIVIAAQKLRYYGGLKISARCCFGGISPKIRMIY